VSRIKRIALCSFTLLALAALATSSASAASPSWWVEGKLLEAKTAKVLAETTEVTTPFVIKATSFDVECNSVQLPKSFIEGEKTGQVNLTIKGCKDVTQPACTIATIKSGPLNITLGGAMGAFKLTFAPAKGELVATIEASGKGCSSTSIPLTGTMACNYPKVETEATRHDLEFTTGSGTKLQFLKEEVTVAGNDMFWLEGAPEPKWSVK
jgi:hypothetical protein